MLLNERILVNLDYLDYFAFIETEKKRNGMEYILKISQLGFGLYDDMMKC